MGGLNSKCEKLNYAEKKWITLPCYPLSDNLDSWASCLLFTPKLFSNRSTIQDGLNLLMGNTNQRQEASGIEQVLDGQNRDNSGQGQNQG